MPNCEETRQILWPLDRPREFVPGEAVARSHLRHCARCQAFFAADAKLGDLLARYGGTATAPEALRTRVLDAIPDDATEGSTPGRADGNQLVPHGRVGRGPSPGPSRLGLVAAVLLAVALPAALLLGRPRAERPEDMFVQDFLRRAVEENVLESPDPADVSRFFMSELGMAVTPARVEDAELARAMVCLLRKERAAMVEYRLGDHTVAHYMLPRSAGSVALAFLLTESRRGVQVAAWSDAQFEHALVSDLPETELAQLASTQFAVK